MVVKFFFSQMNNRCQVKQLTKPLMNFGLVKGQALNICTFGVVRLRHNLKGHMKESWTQEQLIAILLAMLNALWDINFTIPP